MVYIGDVIEFVSPVYERHFNADCLEGVVLAMRKPMNCPPMVQVQTNYACLWFPQDAVNTVRPHFDVRPLLRQQVGKIVELGEHIRVVSGREKHRVGRITGITLGRESPFLEILDTHTLLVLQEVYAHNAHKARRYARSHDPAILEYAQSQEFPELQSQLFFSVPAYAIKPILRA